MSSRSAEDPHTRRAPFDPSGLLAGGGEMGALMRATDWSKTRLGPIETWPSSLRTMLGVVLGSRFPMLLWWGPDLLHLYNDAYRPILRDKHPASLAAPAAEIWAEVWDVAGPMARGVMEGGPATWTEDLQLFIKSGSMAEETYFTFSYSPVPGEDGRVGGILNTVQETTAKVQGERQIRMLHDLAALAAEARSEGEAYRLAAEVLSANELDLPFVQLYLMDEAGQAADLVAEGGWRDYVGPAKPASIILAESGGGTAWPLADAVRTHREVLVDNLTARFGQVPAGRWNGVPDQAIVLPLFRAGEADPRAFLVAGISPHRVLDDRYKRFFWAAADQLESLLTNASAYEAERARAEALAEIDRAKTAFFSNVSHEFRTPLTLILGLVEEALAGAPPALSGEGLDALHRNSMRLLRLVNSLLDFARIEAGRLELAFEPTDLAALTSDLASSFRSLIERTGMRLSIDCPPLPEPVYVDPHQWEKVVLNLLSNAFKFTFEGEIAVSLRAEDGRARLRVRDSGIGIPPKELPHLFDRFHRVEGAKGRSFEGTGIGLSLVEQLVKLHGGLIRASSVEGQGSTFDVELPFGSAHLPQDRIVAPSGAPREAGGTPYLLDAALWMAGEPVVEALPPKPLPPRPAAVETSGPERPRILIADDNADMRTYLGRLLSPRWRVEAVEDGLAALQRAQEHPPDLILSDVMMPGMDGVTLLRELRSRPATRRVPILLLSARAGEEAVLEGLEIGADDYLVKPFSAKELVARVQTHLDLARLRRAWAAELERANEELEAFSYSVSHDLRAPLRAIDGFGSILLDKHADSLNEEGRHYLQRLRSSTQRMAQLIEDLLALSRVSRAPLNRQPVDLGRLAQELLTEWGERDPQRRIDVEIGADLLVQADSRLLGAVMENLLGNAWKYTSKRQTAARIEVGMRVHSGERTYFVRDNGAGFDMRYAEKLFVPFQRLHPDTQFEGTGIGLATVKRIIARHGGRIWAEAAPEKGATFFFTLGEGL